MTECLPTEVETKIVYFIDYWRDFTYHNSIEEEKVHTIVYNPQEFFKELAEEVIFQKSNCQNNKYQLGERYKDFFKGSFFEFYKLPIQSIKILEPTLTLIDKEIKANHPNFSYLLHLLSEIDVLLSDSRLGIECVRELESILMNDQKINDEIDKQKKIKITNKIKILTRLIIFQLIHKKYSRKSINKVIDDIFSGYSIRSDYYYEGRKDDEPVIGTDFPHNIKPVNTTIGDKEYQNKLKGFLDNLTISQRLLAVKNYFEIKPKKFTYIFQIKGLRGEDNLDINFGDVRIYNPKTIKLLLNKSILGLDESKVSECEFFGNKDFVYCNGAVTLDVIDSTEYSKIEAISKLNKVINIISSLYINYKVPIYINTEEVYFINENSTKGYFSYNNNNNNKEGFHYFNNSLEIQTSEDIESVSHFYNSKIINPLNIVDKKIIESLNWKRKAIESLNTNEKILWFWVSLENLIENANDIFNLVSKFIAIRKLYYFAWKHFDKLESIRRWGKGHFRKRIQGLHKLDQVIAFNLPIGEKNHLKNLIDNIHLVQEKLNQEELLHEQLEYLKEIFYEPKECIKLLGDFEKIAKEKLLYVYRIRNKIVHNANTEENTLSEYYLDFISQASTLIAIEFIKKRQDKNLETTESILNNILYDFDKFKLDIETQGTKILLERKN